MLIHSDVSPMTRIQKYLPQSVNFCLSHIDRETLEKISELRLRSGGAVTATVDGNNLLVTQCGLEKYSTVSCKLTDSELDDFIYKVCKGSVYSHEGTLNSFFLTVDGIRIGLSGRVDGKGGIGKITGVNIRLPKYIDGCSKGILEYVRKSIEETGKGLLVISMPGVGKTTLLRDLAQKLSQSSKNEPEPLMKRVCVIDERYEIQMDGIFSNCCIDFLSGIDKIRGIETAVRLLSPQVIICDEIGSPEEAEKIARCKNFGTAFIASYHCDSAENALKTEFIRNMLKQGVFGGIYTLKRQGTSVSGELYIYNEDNA